MNLISLNLTKTSALKLIFISLVFCTEILFLNHAQGEEPNFQEGTEQGSVETIDQQGDKTTVIKRTGKVNNRKGNPRVGEINESDVNKVATRVRSQKFSTLGFGPFGSAQGTNNSMIYGFSYGKSWEATTTGEIRLNSTVALNSEKMFLNFGLGYGYMPSTEDISPIFGAELGVGYFRYKLDDGYKDASGFSGSIFGGIRFLRTADTQLEVIASFTPIFTAGTPGLYGVQLRLLY